jgi:hypothetical protein
MNHICHVMLGVIFSCLSYSSSTAQLPNGEVLQALDWSQSECALPKANPVGVKPDLVMNLDQPGTTKDSALNITYTGTKPLQLSLVRSESNGEWHTLHQAINRIQTPFYAIVGEVRYENASPGSYLEMWSRFAPPVQSTARPGQPDSAPVEPAYFSRTLAETGPLGRLEGTSDWRDFWLPFDQSEATTALRTLDVNLHLTGGSVHLRNLKLVQYAYLPGLIPQPDPQEQVVAKLFREQSYADLKPVEGEIGAWEVTSGGSVWTLTNPPITASKYAITGEIRYRNISKGYLEMACDYAPEEPDGIPPFWLTRTNDPSGVMGRLDGTSNWRTFWLPFDASNRKSRLIGLVLNLKLADPSNPTHSVGVRNVRLIQYPTGVFPAAMTPTGQIPAPDREPGTSTTDPTAVIAMLVLEAQAKPPASAPLVDSSGSAPRIFNRHSFLLGIAATLLTLIVIGTLTFLIRRLRHRHSERELRRIASLDG